MGFLDGDRGFFCTDAILPMDAVWRVAFDVLGYVQFVHLLHETKKGRFSASQIFAPKGHIYKKAPKDHIWSSDALKHSHFDYWRNLRILYERIITASRGICKKNLWRFSILIFRTQEISWTADACSPNSLPARIGYRVQHQG